MNLSAIHKEHAQKDFTFWDGFSFGLCIASLAWSAIFFVFVFPKL